MLLVVRAECLIAPLIHAGLVELADTPALGAGGRKAVWVRVPCPAPLVSRSIMLTLPMAAQRITV